MKQRIHWIDIYKGFFILMMVWGHIPSMAASHGLDNTNLMKCLQISSIYTCFFMQGFFILTGYTSNFERGFKDYCIGIFKSLVIPWISFSLLSRLIGVVIFNQTLFDHIGQNEYFFLIEDYWFLHALIFSKLLYYFIRKYLKTDITRFVVLLIITLCGFYSIEYYYDKGVSNAYHAYNYLHYKDFLCMIIFLWIGDILKRKNLICKITGPKTLGLLSCFYLACQVLKFWLRAKSIDILEICPVILSHGGNICSITQIPAYLLITTSGCLVCFGICKYISQCNLLEYYGSNSLVVYCSHFLLLDIFISIVNIGIYPNSVVSSIIYSMFILFLTIAACTILILLTKRKPFCYLMGKF